MRGQGLLVRNSGVGGELPPATRPGSPAPAFTSAMDYDDPLCRSRPCNSAGRRQSWQGVYGKLFLQSRVNYWYISKGIQEDCGRYKNNIYAGGTFLS